MLSFMLVSGRATAYDPSIFNSLSRSKDALMAQRAHLQDAADDAKAKIDVLQRQLDTINAYLTDTDSALNDVQSALARAQ
jgi:ABC-type transporter Mla subunit MlaD